MRGYLGLIFCGECPNEETGREKKMTYQEACKGKSCTNCKHGPECTCKEPDRGWTLEPEPKCKHWAPNKSAGREPTEEDRREPGKHPVETIDDYAMRLKAHNDRLTRLLSGLLDACELANEHESGVAEDFVAGIRKALSQGSEEPCKECGGSLKVSKTANGVYFEDQCPLCYPDPDKPCDNPDCHGGFVTKAQEYPDGQFTRELVEEPCDECGGDCYRPLPEECTDQGDPQPCAACGGLGSISAANAAFEFEDIRKLSDKALSQKSEEPCEECNNGVAKVGTRSRYSYVPCPKCKGKGE